jgi:hypothetical protein
MEWVVIGFIVLIWLAVASENAARKKRIREAYHFNPPNIHGTRKCATEKELKKAGML